MFEGFVGASGVWELGFGISRILGPCFGVLRLSSGSGFGVKVWGFKTPAKLKTSEYLGVSETEDPPHPPHMKKRL